MVLSVFDDKLGKSFGFLFASKTSSEMNAPPDFIPIVCIRRSMDTQGFDNDFSQGRGNDRDHCVVF